MNQRIGVFVCYCGINIAQTVDVDELTKYAQKLDGVTIAKKYKYMCSDVGANLIKDSIKQKKLNGVVIACCSPRMHETTFRDVVKEGGLNPYQLEIVNIREQCSWVHDDKEKATQKAKSLVKAGVKKATLLQPLETSKIKVTQKALVIGGGIAGIQASLDLANDGFKVYLVEKNPSIGGHMAQLDKTFPTLDCSGCILTPKMMEVANNKNIELLSYSEIEKVEGSIGNYTVQIKKKPRYINTDICTGCGVCAEACRLKGRIDNEFDLNLGKRGAVYMPFPQAIPLIYTIDSEKCLFLTRGKCGDKPACQEACEQNAIDFDQKEEIIDIDVGAIIIATGYELIDPDYLYEYKLSDSPDVITSLQLERLINSSGPSKGEILRPSDNKKPKSITFILCAGSRDENICSWCCRIGCMSALKQVYLLREKLGEEVEINICYTDIRSYGKGYEEFYRKVRGFNTNMFRGRPSEVKAFKDHLNIDVFDTTTNKLFEIQTDMIVVVPAIVPNHDATEIARKLHITQSADGFFLEAHPKLKPMDTFVGGIFIAGCCQGPKDIQDSVSQASGAASRAATILSQKELESEPLIANVDVDICSGCKICISICPYKAIESVTEEKDGKTITHAQVNEALCMGCGACVAACPCGAMQQHGFKDKQILPMIDEII